MLRKLLARLLFSVHRLNLDRSCCLILLLPNLPASQLASVHRLDFRSSVVFDYRRHRVTHESPHRKTELLCVRLTRLFRCQTLVIHLGELGKVQFAVLVRVVVLHQSGGVRNEITVAHVQPELLKNAHQLALLQLTAAIGVEFVERDASGIRGGRFGNGVTLRRSRIRRFSRPRSRRELFSELLPSLLASVHSLNLGRCVVFDYHCHCPSDKSPHRRGELLCICRSRLFRNQALRV